MNKILLTLICLASSALLFAQRGYDSESEHAAYSKMKIDAWEDADGERTKNEYYLNHEWTLVSLFLKSGCLIEGRFMRLNLLSNKFEIKYGSKVKLLDASKVEYFEFNQKGKIRLFESVNSYGPEERAEQGFFEVIVSGNPGLLQMTFLEKRKRSSVKSTSAKKKKYKLSKQKKHLLYREGKCFEIPSDKKYFYSFFGDHEKKVLQYAQQHNIDIRDTDDLKNLILHLKSGA